MSKRVELPQPEERIVDILARSQNISDLIANCGNSGLHARDIPAYFARQPERVEPVADLLKGTTQSPYPMGVVLSQASGIVTPDRAAAHHSVEAYDPTWKLCGASEERLSDSIDLNAVLVVGDGAFIVKFWGRLTALCVRTINTTNGTFVEGNWYSPKSVGLRKQLREAFVAGDPKPSIVEGNWLLMKSVPQGAEGDKLIAKAKAVALDNSHQLPATVMGRTRESFMYNHFESYRNGLEE